MTTATEWRQQTLREAKAMCDDELLVAIRNLQWSIEDYLANIDPEYAESPNHTYAIDDMESTLEIYWHEAHERKLNPFGYDWL